MGALEKYPRITPFLWFDSQAEEAADFYVSVFKNSRRLDVMGVPADSVAGPKGKVLTVTFELDGQTFTALNGGPTLNFTEAVSFVVLCDSHAEVDEYWAKLTAGGAESQCGWLKDKFGLSWQIVPARLPELVKNPKAMQAMMEMKKIDLAELERAAGRSRGYSCRASQGPSAPELARRKRVREKAGCFRRDRLWCLIMTGGAWSGI